MVNDRFLTLAVFQRRDDPASAARLFAQFKKRYPTRAVINCLEPVGLAHRRQKSSEKRSLLFPGSMMSGGITNGVCRCIRRCLNRACASADAALAAPDLTTAI